MNTPVAPRRSSRVLVAARTSLLAIWAALLASCGGGVGTGGTGSFAMGPVSGFGSIFIGGIEFDDARAMVLDDDGVALAGGRAAIRLGMVAEVQAGDIVPGTFGPTAVATTIQLARLVQGTVTSIDATAATLTVLGQTLQINGSTVFDPAITGGLAGLRAGDTVSVHALADAAGNAVATRIEFANADEPWRLRGFALGVDPQAKRFMVGAATLDYSSALNVPSDFAAGRFIHAKLARTGSPGELRVSSFSPATSAPSNVSKVTAEGIVTAPIAGLSFRIGALTVDTRNANVVPPSAVLLPGTQVQVEGRLDAGTLVAETITVTSRDASDKRNFQLAGSVTGLDAARRTFVVHGITVEYSSARLVNGTAAALAAPGASVRVQGTLSADRTLLQARIVTFP